ncbi:mRNA decay activator protein ZFP36L3-like isoform X2 [Anguilla anguilla]|uniref:mRNA decay activator protein ZFP36L3-like isoform X2 n=1 Tax=Anguilla anguilla TaxID=7936 RepID=UPI0015AA8D91|nr:mRNA decay activator protein ZFP36L3-like isoform X2 [Anguilla anguilla]
MTSEFDDLEEEEKSMMGDKLPPFPVAPTKLKSIQTEAAGPSENSTAYSENPALSGLVERAGSRGREMSTSSPGTETAPGTATVPGTATDQGTASGPGTALAQGTAKGPGMVWGPGTALAQGTATAPGTASGPGTVTAPGTASGPGTAIGQGTATGRAMVLQMQGLRGQQTYSQCPQQEVHMEVRRLGRSEPALSATRVERLETMEDFHSTQCTENS